MISGYCPIDLRLRVASVRVGLIWAHGSVAVGGETDDGTVPAGAPPPLWPTSKVEDFAGLPLGAFAILTNGRGGIGMIPCWVVLCVVVTMTLLEACRRRRRRFRPSAPACEVCGYDLRNRPQRCPECGTENTDPEVVRPRIPAPPAFDKRLGTLMETLRLSEASGPPPAEGRRTRPDDERPVRD
jgi:hypothetical protein